MSTPLAPRPPIKPCVPCTRPLTWIAIHIEYGSYGRAFVSETATSVGDRKHAEHSPLTHVHTLEKPVNNWRPRWRDGRTARRGELWRKRGELWRKRPKIPDSAIRSAKSWREIPIALLCAHVYYFPVINKYNENINALKEMSIYKVQKMHKRKIFSKINPCIIQNEQFSKLIYYK